MAGISIDARGENGGGNNRRRGVRHPSWRGGNNGYGGGISSLAVLEEISGRNNQHKRMLAARRIGELVSEDGVVVSNEHSSTNVKAYKWRTLFLVAASAARGERHLL